MYEGDTKDKLVDWNLNDDAMKKTESKRISAEIKMVRSRVT